MDHTEIFERIKRYMGEYLERDVSHISLDTPLTSIVPGIDSLQLFESMLYLEEQFEVKLGDNVMDRIQTVGNLVREIDSALTVRSGRP